MSMLWWKRELLALYLLTVQGIALADGIDTQALAYRQLLQHHMQVIEQSKLILDDHDSTATPLQQQQALCERLYAYQQIVHLGDQFAHVEQAQSMKHVAQFYLNQQSASFQQSGMAVEQWCPAKP